MKVKHKEEWERISRIYGGQQTGITTSYAEEHKQKDPRNSCTQGKLAEFIAEVYLNSREKVTNCSEPNKDPRRGAKYFHKEPDLLVNGTYKIHVKSTNKRNLANPNIQRHFLMNKGEWLFKNVTDLDYFLVVCIGEKESEVLRLFPCLETIFKGRQASKYPDKLEIPF